MWVPTPPQTYSYLSLEGEDGEPNDDGSCEEEGLVGATHIHIGTSVVQFQQITRLLACYFVWYRIIYVPVPNDTAQLEQVPTYLAGTYRCYQYRTKVGTYLCEAVFL